MAKITFLLLTVIIFFSGCSIHYYDVGKDKISLYLKVEEASDVHFQYSLDGYQCHEAEKVKKGLWEVVVPPVDEFSYFYMVDGRMYVPPCLFTEYDDFGNENCIFSKGM